jgi:hypothetical protein
MKKQVKTLGGKIPEIKILCLMSWAIFFIFV